MLCRGCHLELARGRLKQRLVQTPTSGILNVIFIKPYIRYLLLNFQQTLRAQSQEERSHSVQFVQRCFRRGRHDCQPVLSFRAVCEFLLSPSSCSVAPGQAYDCFIFTRQGAAVAEALFGGAARYARHFKGSMRISESNQLPGCATRVV